MKKLFILVSLWMWSAAIMAQSDLPSVTENYVLTNAYIKTAPGATPYYGSIAIESGIISAVGRSINMPVDAQVIDLDSAHVYAAFIAPLSHAGIKNKEADNQRVDVDRPGYPPNDIAGITPEKSLSEVYTPNDNSVKGLREAGFAIAHSVPKGGMLPGMGSVVNLSGDSYDMSVLQKDMSIYATYEGGPRVFPATTIGVMAKFREMYKNAELGMTHEKRFKQNPLNRKRASQDAATRALYSVVDHSVPIFFNTESTLDISRALMLQEELGFDLFLGEAKGVPHAEKILKSNVQPTLFSLDLPKEDETDEADLSDEEKALLAKKKESSKSVYEQPTTFAAANLPFTFSFIDVKSKEIHKHVGTLIEHGLSFDDALKALTTDAAKALNIDHITGSIQAGKAANLMVTTDTLFKEKTQISKVFIEGKLFKMEAKKKKKSENSGEDIDFSGTYSYSIDIPGMSPQGTMTVVKSGDSYEISLTSNQAPGETFDATNVEVDGNNMSYDFTINTQGMEIAVSNDVTLDGDSLEGTVSIPDFGSFELTGEKIESPE